jgi:2-oxoglutarate ferredoxin oxidoreductase subunit gamma
MVDQLPDHEVHGFPFTELARNKVGTPMVANIMALGAIAALTKIVSKRALLEAIKKRAPKGTEERNLKAAEIGFGLIHKRKPTEKRKRN